MPWRTQRTSWCLLAGAGRSDRSRPVQVRVGASEGRTALQIRLPITERVADGGVDLAHLESVGVPVAGRSGDGPIPLHDLRRPLERLRELGMVDQIDPQVHP